MEDNNETLWEFEDAMRFESPATYAIVEHDDGFTCDAGSNLDSAVQCTFTPDGVILARTVGVRH